MHIFSYVRDKIITAILDLQAAGKLPKEALQLEAVNTEAPKDASHGDMASNAAMVLAKQVSMPPRDVANLIVAQLKNDPEITAIDVAGPGFINMSIAWDVWKRVLLSVLEAQRGYGYSDLGKGKRINLEFVSANPTGPMHIGHARGAVFGDSLARLLVMSGYDVTREYYINDAGAQVDVLAKSAFLRYKEALGMDIGAIPEGLYPGEYLKPVGAALREYYGNSLLEQSEEEWLPLVRKFAIDAMLALIKNDLIDLGVEHDVYVSERSIQEQNKVQESLELLQSHGVIYRGILEPPKGKLPDDWEPREQVLFRSTDFGDDVDRAIQKSDGSWTYFASDIAYHKDKLDRGFDHMILELGADHGGYLKRMKAAVGALSGGKAQIDILFHQLVNLFDGGVPLKMSKRAGQFVTVRQVIDEVGKDIIRFMMLTRKNDAVLDFDLQKVKEQSKDNPVFYVQYAHARCCSVLRHAAGDHPDIMALQLDEKTLDYLAQDDMVQVIKVLALWPRILESAAQHLEPHRIAFYLHDVASALHQLWNKGKNDAELRFITPEQPEATRARLALLEAVRLVICCGLQVFNVTPMEEMH